MNFVPCYIRTRVVRKLPGQNKKHPFFYNDQHSLDVVSFELYTLRPAMFQGRYASFVEQFVKVLEISINSVDYPTIV